MALLNHPATTPDLPGLRARVKAMRRQVVGQFQILRGTAAFDSPFRSYGLLPMTVESGRKLRFG